MFANIKSICIFVSLKAIKHNIKNKQNDLSNQKIRDYRKWFTL